MKISKIKITNFRSLENIETSFDNLVAFVGRNSSGKSSLLQALNVFFTPGFPIEIEDYYNRNVDRPIEIIITFESFTHLESEEFSHYITDSKLIVEKIIQWNPISEKSLDEYYSYVGQIPAFNRIQVMEAGLVDKRRAFIELVTSGTLPDLSGQPTSWPQTVIIMNEYERQHPELKQLTRTKGTFFGARNVGAGRLDNYTKFLYLPARARKDMYTLQYRFCCSRVESYISVYRPRLRLSCLTFLFFK